VLISSITEFVGEMFLMQFGASHSVEYAHLSYCPYIRKYIYIHRAGIGQLIYRLDYRLDDWGSIPSRGTNEISFSLPPHPDQQWGTPSPLSNGYWGSYPVSKASKV
jgi:hypothetical protein